MADATDFEQTLGRLPPKQFARLAKLIAAERARRRADKSGTSDAGMMSNQEFARWAADQIANAEKSSKQKDNTK